VVERVYVFKFLLLGFDEMDIASGQHDDGGGGIILVISLLIALMKDQVDALL
jgi:hypothetical protein